MSLKGLSVWHWPFLLVAAFQVYAAAPLRAVEAGVVQATVESPADAKVEATKPPRVISIEKAINPADPEAKLQRLTKAGRIWLDAKNRQVIVDGEICLTRGMLEMFACPKGTKEHESIVSVDSKAYVAHAALLAVGAKPGSPVKYNPEYVQATGASIQVTVYWNDARGALQTARAQDWVRNIKTQQAMQQSWIFGGSGFYVDEMTNKKYYLAEQGDFICVANFPSAMLDLPFDSPQANDELLFEAFSERIPPRGTKVKLVLTPQPELVAKAQPSAHNKATDNATESERRARLESSKSTTVK